MTDLQQLRKAFAHHLKPGPASEATPEELAQFAKLLHEAVDGQPGEKSTGRRSPFSVAERRGFFLNVVNLVKQAGGRALAGAGTTPLDGSQLHVVPVHAGATIDIFVSNKSDADLNLAFVHVSPDTGNELLEVALLTPHSEVETAQQAPPAGESRRYALATFRQEVPARLLQLPLEQWSEFGLESLSVFRIESH